MNIYEFDNFKTYLSALLDELQQHDPLWTYRKFASQVGFSNPGFIGDVIAGRRKLSDSSVEKLISGLNFSENESHYFRIMVEYGQTKDSATREQLYHKLHIRRTHSSFSKINPALTKYYSDYRYLLVRNGILAFKLSTNFEEFGQFLYPSITGKIVEKIVSELVSWDIIYKDESGIYTVANRFVEPSSTLKEQVKELNKEWIRHAIDAQNKIPPEKRHISTSLLATSPATSKKIAEKIEILKKEIWELVKTDTENPSVVMQLNVQYFPRSRRKG
jgi:uncharacterized protein (TIGR02147 family)